MADQKELELIEKINAELEKSIEYEAKRARLRGESVDKLITQRDILVQQREQYAIAIDYLTTEQTKLEEIYNIQNARLEKLKKDKEDGKQYDKQRLEDLEKEVQLIEDINNLKKAALSNNEEEAKAAQKKLEDLQKELTLRRKIVDSQQAGIKAGAGIVEQAAKLVGFQKGIEDTLTGNFIKALSTGEGLKTLVTSIGTEMAETFGPANALQFFISNSIQVAKALDELQASFVAATGATREFSTSIEEVFRDNVEFGVSLQESSDAIEGLYTNFGAFTSLNKATRNEISGTTALLSQLGVSASTTGDNFNFLVSQLGMSVSEAENTIRAFTETGAAIGIPPQQLNDAFRNLSPRLAAFGRQAPEIFMKTARTAKQLGFTVDELGNTMFALSEGLDTFQESASAVAAINLSLGGSFVNAFDLTMAAAEGPAAQLDLLRDGFQAAGKTLSEMPFFQQKMLASELGLELGVLQQVIDGNMDSQQALAKENPLEELAKKANSALDRLNDTIQSMSAGLGTLIDMFTFAIDNIKLIGGAVLFASAAFKMYALEQAAATTAQSLNIVVTEQGTLAVTKQNGQILTNNTLTAANSGAQTQNAAAKTANAGATVGLAGAETTAAAATNGLSFSMKGLAASINMVFLGLGAAVGAFMIFDAIGAKLADTLGPGITAFIALAAAIGLAYTAFTLGVGTAGILAGAAALAAGVVSFKAAIGGYEGGGEGPTIPGLATGGMIVGSGMAMVGEEGPELVSLPKGAQVVNNQSTTNLMKTMEETKVSNTTNTTANDGAMLQALLRIEKALNMQPAGTAGSSAQPINVSVQLDKKKVGEATVDYINKRYDVFTSN